jgi:hypothetical protein
MEENITYTATLQLTGNSGEDVRIELKFDPPRHDLKDQPVAYMTMDFFMESCVLPFVGMMEEASIDRTGSVEVEGNNTEN